MGFDSVSLHRSTLATSLRPATAPPTARMTFTQSDKI